jgi:predicted nucleotidyltransferase
MLATTHDEAIALALVERLRTVFDVQRAVWFGSRAIGRGTPDSDWDLLVVAATPLDPWARMSLALRVTQDLAVSRDIFVATPDEYARMRTQRGTIPWAAETDGRVLAA